MESSKRTGRTLTPGRPVPVCGYGSVAGTKEEQGPLGGKFDETAPDARYGEKTWERAECKMQRTALERALGRGSMTLGDMDMIIAGDLLNQSLASCYGMSLSGAPFLGLFGACSTMALSLALGAMLLDGGFARRCACVTSSHFCTAERQFRMPLEYGGQRTPTAQRTVTGSGAVLLGDGALKGPYITRAVIGRIVDMGIKDANNMGAAMAPAAVDTLSAFFADTGTAPSDYDLILTGDLGSLGREIVTDLMEKRGFDMAGRYDDCGCIIFDADRQDVHAGGSGCGCSALVLCAHVLPGMRSGELKRVLLAGTGALLSPVAVQQGGSIPSITHLVELRAQA